MKRLITAASSLGTGSYMMNREGKLFPVKLHAPSTSYIWRELRYLSPTDAEFLFNAGYISNDEVISILIYNIVEYFESVADPSDYGILGFTKFSQWSDLNYAPNVNKLFRSIFMRFHDLEEVNDCIEDYPSFTSLNDKYYPMLLNEFIKIAVYENLVNIRINSEDGYDWNTAIIDKLLCNPKYNFRSASITILRESSKGYKAYFEDASLQEILECDKVVLSSQYLQPVTDVDGVVRYE